MDQRPKKDGRSGSMRRCLSRTFFITALASLAATATFAAFSQSEGGDFAIRKHTINGGGRSTGNEFVLSGTAGQPDASAQAARGGLYRLTGGFWATASLSPDDTIFSDGFEGQQP